MGYTCENCKSRHCWECEEFVGEFCENFVLDETTLSEEEQKMLRAFRQAIKEQEAKFGW